MEASPEAQCVAKDSQSESAPDAVVAGKPGSGAPGDASMAYVDEEEAVDYGDSVGEDTTPFGG